MKSDNIASKDRSCVVTCERNTWHYSIRQSIYSILRQKILLFSLVRFLFIFTKLLFSLSYCIYKYIMHNGSTVLTEAFFKQQNVSVCDRISWPERISKAA